MNLFRWRTPVLLLALFSLRQEHNLSSLVFFFFLNCSIPFGYLLHLGPGGGLRSGVALLGFTFIRASLLSLSLLRICIAR